MGTARLPTPDLSAASAREFAAEVELHVTEEEPLQLR